MSKRDDDLLELKSDKQRDMAPSRPKAFRLKTVECGEDEDLEPVTTCVLRSADAAELKAKPKPGGPNQELLMECYRQLRLEGIGEPNPGGAGFPEQSQYWCLSNDRLKEMFVGKKGGSNNSSAYSSALNGLKSRNLLQMNGGLVWMQTADGKCTSAERRGAAASSYAQGKRACDGVCNFVPTTTAPAATTNTKSLRFCLCKCRCASDCNTALGTSSASPRRILVQSIRRSIRCL